MIGAGDVLCNVSSTSHICTFSRPVTPEDNPLILEARKDGETIVSVPVAIRVLGGPEETPIYWAEEVLTNEDKAYVTETYYEYQPCPSDSKEPSRVCDLVSDPCPTPEDPHKSCYSEENCRCLKEEQRNVEVANTSVAAFVWKLSGLFSDSVITKELHYVTGASEGNGCQVANPTAADNLEFEGPGITGIQVVPLGQGVLGNGESPNGVWRGSVQAGDEISLSPDGQPLVRHGIKLKIACDE